MKQRVLIFISVFALALSCFCTAAPAEKTPVPDVTARNVYMINTNTGAVAYEKNSDEVIYPASLTKLVTMLVAADMVTDYNEIVTVTDECYDDLVVGSSNINLKDGEMMTVDDLMYAIAISSANEAANALALHLCGDISEFVDKMNDKAAQLGTKNTNFVNTHGLHDENHYTTASDMALIASAAFSNETVKKYITTASHEISATNKTDEPRTLVTTNSLIRRNSDQYYRYCRGGKTGSTTPAGYNLISLAEKNDVGFILVAMHVVRESGGTNTVFSDSRKLYDWAFQNYKSAKIASDSDIITEVEVELSAKGDHLILLPQKNVYSVIPVDLDETTLERKIETQEKIFAPVAAGDELGSVTFSKDGVTYAKIPLVAGVDIKRSTVLYYLHLIEQFFSNIWVRIVCAALGVLIIIYIIIMISNNRRRRRKRLRKRIRF